MIIIYANRTKHPEDTPIVFDASTCIIKVRFAGDEIPIVLFPAQGDLKPWTLNPFVKEGLYTKDTNRFFPESLPSIIKTPENIQSNYTQNLNATLAERWKYIIQTGLDIEIGNHPIYFIEPPNTQPEERKKMADFLFKQLHFKKIAFNDSALTSSLSMGRHSVFIVELTANRITITPIKGIYRIEEAFSEMKGGGRLMTEYIANQIKERIHDSNIDVYSLARRIKETSGILYCPNLNHPGEPNESKDLFKKKFGTSAHFPIPNTDRTLEINENDPIRWKCVEALFQKGDQGIYPQPISEFIMDSINKCPESTQLEMKSNIAMVGGASDIAGLTIRLQQELKKLDVHNPLHEIHVIQPREVQLLSWIGGSIECSQRLFEKCWLSENEYFAGEYHKKYVVYNIDGKFSYEDSHLSFTKDSMQNNKY